MKNKLKLLLGTTLFLCGIANSQVGIGTSTPASSSALDVTSTNGGVLISRMSSAQRDAIASPANGLLIFNTSNNTFEVFKTSCGCWVTINDQGDTPASSVVNTAPSAGSLNYTGSFTVGKSATLIYTYLDNQADPQGATTFTWFRATTNAGTDAIAISGVNTGTYTFQPTDLGMFVRASVSPRASTGVLNGVPTFGGWFQVQPSTIPIATSLVVDGAAAVASNLNATYTFSGGSGTEDLTPVTPLNLTAGSTFIWQYATTSTGIGIGTANLYGAIAFTKNYTPQSDLMGRYIRFGVRAKDSNGLQATNFEYSPWVGPLTAGVEVAPTATNVSYSPAPSQGLTHTATYTFSDGNNDPEGTTTFQWYRADDDSGSNAVAISGATSITYVGTEADVNKYLGFGVTPKATTGTTTGTESIYYNINPTVAVATYTFTASPIKQLPFFHQSRNMNDQNAIQVEINVTSEGGIAFSSTLVNGYSFPNNKTVTTGLQWITLNATGTQTAYNAAGDTFTLTGAGLTTETKTFTINHVLSGQNLTTYFNGIDTASGLSIDPTLASYTTGQTFNNNATCQAMPISTGFTSGTCSGSVTHEGGTYNLVLINGQCWTQRNMKVIPSNYASQTPTSWLNVTFTDVGQWGYYSTTATGSAGWGTVELAANEGYLYQFTAAMNGMTYERAQGICPAGFHIPSDCEWMYFEHGIGLSISNQNSAAGYRAFTNANEGAPGNKLRSTTVAGYANTGFTGLLNGSRNSNGSYTGRLGTAFWWSSTTSGAGVAFARRIRNDLGISKNGLEKAAAYGVRCLKD